MTNTTKATKKTRTTQDKIAGTPEIVLINGKTHKPKRLTLGEVNSLVAEKGTRLKHVQAMQRQLVKVQQAYNSGALDSLSMTAEEAEAYITQVQDATVDLAVEFGSDHNMWLLEKLYPEAKASGDLDLLDFDEYDAALEAIFMVNPSLGKSKTILLMNPLMNQNG